GSRRIGSIHWPVPGVRRWTSGGESPTKALGAIALMAIVAVVVAGVFVAHAAPASSTVGTDNVTGTAAAAGSGDSTATHTFPNITNTTVSSAGTTAQGIWP